MTVRNRKDPFGAELRRFADNIDIHQFRSLSPGIGLGRIDRPDPLAALHQPYSQGTKNEAAVAPTPSVSTLPEFGDHRGAEARPARRSEGSTPLRRLFPKRDAADLQPIPEMFSMTSMNHDIDQSTSDTPVGSRPQRRYGFMARTVFRLLGHCVDMVSVLSGIVAALAVGCWFLAPAGHSFLERFFGWTPVTELVQLNLLELLIGIYVLFAIYWVFFRLVVGFTVGQGLFRQALRRAPAASEFVEGRPN